MKADIHQRTQESLATGELSAMAADARLAIEAHLDNCEQCRDFAEGISGVERALHSISIAAGSALVGATRSRLHARAAQLEEQRHRLRLVAMATGLVAMFALVSTPVLLGAFAWAGNWLHVSSPVWQAAFVLTWIAPTLLACVLLAAFGAHWSQGHTAPE
jgi:predicted anti-sigma-YlaC factor YlaD